MQLSNHFNSSCLPVSFRVDGQSSIVPNADAYLFVQGCKLSNRHSDKVSTQGTDITMMIALFSLLSLGVCISMGVNPVFSVLFAVGIYQFLSA